MRQVPGRNSVKVLPSPMSLRNGDAPAQQLGQLAAQVQAEAGAFGGAGPVAEPG